MTNKAVRRALRGCDEEPPRTRVYCPVPRAVDLGRWAAWGVGAKREAPNHRLNPAGRFISTQEFAGMADVAARAGRGGRQETQDRQATIR